MATQTGSIDLKAAKKAHDDAEKVATNYVADISNGILVHPVGDTDNGVKITDRVEIMRDSDGSSVSVAEFGQSVRIGQVEEGYTKIYLDPGSSDGIYRIITPEGVTALNVILDDNNISPETTVRRTYYDYRLDAIGDVSSTKKTVTKVISIPELSSILTNGQSFSVGIGISGYGYAYNSPLKSIRLDFEKGSNETKNIIVYEEISGSEVKVTTVYNGSYTFDVTIEAKKINTSNPNKLYLAYEAIDYIEYIKSSVLLPIHKYHGDIYLNDNECGGIYAGLDVDSGASKTSDAVSGADADLFNAIRWLGWYDDVMFGLVIDRDPDLGGLGLDVGMTVYSWVGTIPEYAYRIVNWESSDDTVATVDIDTNSDHQIAITGVSVGTCTITGSYELVGKTYQKTLEITVTAPS